MAPPIPTARLEPPTSNPTDAGCGNDGETIVSVRRSKLGFRGFLPTPVGELGTKFEFDLFGVGAPIGQLRLELFF